MILSGKGLHFHMKQIQKKASASEAVAAPGEAVAGPGGGSSGSWGRQQRRRGEAVTGPEGGSSGASEAVAAPGAQ